MMSSYLIVVIMVWILACSYLLYELISDKTRYIQLYRAITKKDIPVPIGVPGDEEMDNGYNLGDLLNMPSLFDCWNQTPHHTEGTLQRMNHIGSFYRNSILDLYCRRRKDNDEIIPNIPLIQECVRLYTEKNRFRYEKILTLVKADKTLTVHMRNGDHDSEPEYLDRIHSLSHKYKTVIIISGIHCDVHVRAEADKITNFLNTMKKVLSFRNNIYVCLGEADIHLSLMMHASHLLLHKGGFSCLGSIVSTGTLYITPLFIYKDRSRWKEQVGKEYVLLE